MIAYPEQYIVLHTLVCRNPHNLHHDLMISVFLLVMVDSTWRLELLDINDYLRELKFVSGTCLYIYPHIDISFYFIPKQKKVQVNFQTMIPEYNVQY